MKAKRIYGITETPAAKDYTGAGWGWIVLKNDDPQLIIYHPDKDQKEKPKNWQTNIRIDPDNISEIEKTTEVWFGFIENFGFNCLDKLFPPVKKYKLKLGKLK